MNSQRTTFLRLSNAAQDLSNAAREAYALSALGYSHVTGKALSSADQAIAEEFESIALILGFRVEKIDPTASEPAALQAAE